MATLNANARQAYLLRAGTGHHALTLSHLSVVCYITEYIHHQHVQHKKKPGWVVVVVVVVVVVNVQPL